MQKLQQSIGRSQPSGTASGAGYSPSMSTYGSAKLQKS